MNSKNKVNMREIAHMLNLSTATVSRALRTPEKVNPETLERVLKVVEEQNYTPRKTPPSSANLIAFLISNINNLFYNEILRQLTDIAAEKGFFLLACNTNGNPLIEETMFEYFKKIGCAGIILTGLTQLTRIDADVPVILLSSPGNMEGSFFSIHSDIKSGIQVLVDYLFKLNHRRIGFISGDYRSLVARQRTASFIECMKHLELITPDNCIYPGNFDIKSGFSAFDYFYSLSDMPTAIIAANDDMAKGFIIRANSVGAKIPEDISICGIDAIAGDTFSPKITSIHQDIASIARMCFSIIHNDDETIPPKHQVLPVSFVPGSTCYRL